ncbi:MAG: transposase [Comamonadaceae bacterium]|nr:MAG: transposase [Comamonadaceae bacterium]
MDATAEHLVSEKHDLLALLFDEQTRRLWASTEAQALGRSGVSLVARATGMSRTTVHQGQRLIRGVIELHG